MPRRVVAILSTSMSTPISGSDPDDTSLLPRGPPEVTMSGIFAVTVAAPPKRFVVFAVLLETWMMDRLLSTWTSTGVSFAQSTKQSLEPSFALISKSKSRPAVPVGDTVARRALGSIVKPDVICTGAPNRIAG